MSIEMKILPLYTTVTKNKSTCTKPLVEIIRPRGTNNSLRSAVTQQRAFFHIEILNSVELSFLRRNTRVWPNFLHSGDCTVEIGRCSSS